MRRLSHSRCEIFTWGEPVSVWEGRSLSKIVMMTGDSERTAKAIAKRVGVDEYYAEVLPEDKAGFFAGKCFIKFSG